MFFKVKNEQMSSLDTDIYLTLAGNLPKKKKLN